MTVDCTLLIFVHKRKAVSEIWFSDDATYQNQNENIFINKNKIKNTAVRVISWISS